MIRYSIALLIGISLLSCNTGGQAPGADQSGSGSGQSAAGSAAGMSAGKASADGQAVMALLYQQKAAEYRALCLQAYNIARERVTAAARTQRSALPLAVVTDLDETALDNSADEAWLYKHDTTYWASQFDHWCLYHAADSVPGSVTFFKFVNGLKDRKGRKVDIYYVTNRNDSLVWVTMKNMDSLGFPQLSRSHFLFKKESSSKQSRRDSISAGHTIVALLGDNLTDMDSAFDGQEPAARRQVTDRLSARWGQRYIVFPNAVYGDWESALYKGYIKEHHGYPSLQARDSIRAGMLEAFPE
jgi:5'-nucleotidase (lipoprotein e(P4) family)